MLNISSAIDQERLHAALERAGISTNDPDCLQWGGDLAARAVIAAAEEADPEDDPDTVRKDALERIEDLYDDAFEREAKRLEAELAGREGVYCWTERTCEGEDWLWVEAGKNRLYAVYQDEGFCFAIGWAELSPYGEALRRHCGGWGSWIFGVDDDGMDIVMDEADYWTGPEEGHLSDTILDLIPQLRARDEERLNAALERMGVDAEDYLPLKAGGPMEAGGAPIINAILDAVQEADPEDSPDTVRKDAESRIHALFRAAFKREAKRVEEKLADCDGVRCWREIGPDGEEQFWTESKSGRTQVYAEYSPERFIFLVSKRCLLSGKRWRLGGGEDFWSEGFPERAFLEEGYLKMRILKMTPGSPRYDPYGW